MTRVRVRLSVPETASCTSPVITSAFASAKSPVMGTDVLVSIAWYCPPTNEYFSGSDPFFSCAIPGSSLAATGCQPRACGATDTFAPVLLPDGFSNTSGSWLRKSARSGPYTSVASCSISREILFPASATLLNTDVSRASASAAAVAIATPSLSVTLVISCLPRKLLRPRFRRRSIPLQRTARASLGRRGAGSAASRGQVGYLQARGRHSFRRSISYRHETADAELAYAWRITRRRCREAQIVAAPKLAKLRNVRGGRCVSQSCSPPLLFASSDCRDATRFGDVCSMSASDL